MNKPKKILAFANHRHQQIRAQNMNQHNRYGSRNRNISAGK